MLNSMMGPNGSCKAVVTGGGYLEIASTSTLLMTRLEMESPICRCINNMATGLPDHGLYFAVLLSHLLEQQWQESTFSKQKLLKTINNFVQKLRKLLLSEKVCIQVDFDSVNSLLPLVRTIISSKCSLFLSGMDINGLCIEIIKVFLNCVDDQTSSINKLYIKVEHGANVYTSYKGLIYNVTESYNLDIVDEIIGKVKILIFTLKLEENESKSFSVINKVESILDNVIQSGVKIIACQKTVAPEIKLFLKRKRLVLLERMGLDFTSMLINISQAFPISQLCIDISESAKLTGHLSSVKRVQFNESEYILLHNESVPVGTLVIGSCSLLGVDHIKILIQQAVGTLRSVAAHPVLIIGGGCLETWIIAQIHLLKESWKDIEFRKISVWMQHALQSTSSAVEIDTVYHHGWREGGQTCGCRLVTQSDVEQEGGSWVFVREVISSQLTLGAPKQSTLILHQDMLVESHQQKANVINNVLEAFANLSDVGLIVFKTDG